MKKLFFKNNTLIFLFIFLINEVSAEYLFKSPKKLDIIINSGNEYEGKNVIVFRHINKDSEGWGDIVIGKINMDWYINTELDYRNAAKSIGYDSYYTRITSFRCQNQDYIYPEVPKVDISCSTDFASSLRPYILYYKPDNISIMPSFYRRSFDREYGIYGSGSWLTILNGNILLEENKTTLEDVSLTGSNFSRADITIPANSYIMTAN